MKKKVISALVVGVLTVVLVIWGVKHSGNVSENESEVIVQVDGVETETDTEVQDGDQSSVDEFEAVTELESTVEQDNIAELENIAEQENNTEQENGTAEPDSEVDTTLGDDLTQEESITSNSGVDIPVLNKFNYAGLDSAGADEDGMMDWFGYAGDTDAPGYAAVTACAGAMNELTESLDISGGFLPQQDHISFSFTDIYAETGDLELRRDFENGYYTIGINYDMSDSEAFYPIEDGKDALTLLCSVVSSTPTELAEFLYEESFVVEECATSETTWVSVGDCLVQWGGYDSNGEDVLVYKVKANTLKNN